MANQITCPKCKRTIANNPVIDQAAKSEGDDRQFIICECGERIGYWHIAAQLRNQKKLGYRIKHWFLSRNSGDQK